MSHQQTFYVRGSQSLERDISEGLVVADLSDAGAELHVRVTRWLTEKNVARQAATARATILLRPRPQDGT